MNLDTQTLQAIAAIIGGYAALFAGIYAVVTKPILSRLEGIEARLIQIENHLKTHGERIAKLEERIPPLVHH